MSTTLPFKKMHGLGNDFAVFDARSMPLSLTADQARLIGDRRWGIGCDQIIVLEPSTQADVFMRIFNNDGSQAEACGNATRCVAALVNQETGKQGTMSIETLRGVLDVTSADGGNTYRVNMGAPYLTPAGVPVNAAAIDQLDLDVEGYSTATAVGMGNPHCVLFGPVVALDDTKLLALAAPLEVHKLFPNRANVHFVEVLDRQRIRQRVFERGAGITGASGSGACAGAVASIYRGFTDNRVQVVLDSGVLEIEWAGGANDPVYMSGPWALAYEGEISI